MYKNQEIGMMGVLHPVILENLKWDYPTSLIEINLEPLFRDFK
jgi:phenylalanyl-tRNA synthetase beta chain